MRRRLACMSHRKLFIMVAWLWLAFVSALLCKLVPTYALPHDVYITCCAQLVPCRVPYDRHARRSYTKWHHRPQLTFAKKKKSTAQPQIPVCCDMHQESSLNWMTLLGNFTPALDNRARSSSLSWEPRACQLMDR